MARVLIIETAGRGERLGDALRERGYEVRAIDTSPPLPDRVLSALEDVTTVCWLMAVGDGRDPEINGEQLKSVLFKVVDTGVRGFVFERSGDAPNPHVEHARETWHIPVAEVDAGSDDWIAAVAAAVDLTLGVTR